MIKSIFKWFFAVSVILILLFFIVPNVFNTSEQSAFSDALRLENAIENYNINLLPDSVTVKAGTYYRKSGFHIFLYGEKYRTLWNTPVKVKVLNVSDFRGGLLGEQLGGGMQTIGLDMISVEGYSYDLRSVNKDQSKALPAWLQYSYARLMFRDQVAAMNPYASVVIPTLADAVGILHTNPAIVFVPYDSTMKTSFAKAMAGRLAILEERPDTTWTNTRLFNNAVQIIDTEDMYLMAREEQIAIDTSLFLRSRLFDILISDWDRHEGQWEWALVSKEKKRFFQPIPKDRDMAFYKFDEGLLSSIALMINPKFQSFRSQYGNIKALTSNSTQLDRDLLGNYNDIQKYYSEAEYIQSKLSNNVIETAFHQYPPEIFEIVGAEHIQILKSRRDQLAEAAKLFYEAVQN